MALIIINRAKTGCNLLAENFFFLLSSDLFKSQFQVVILTCAHIVVFNQYFWIK